MRQYRNLPQLPFGEGPLGSRGNAGRESGTHSHFLLDENTRTGHPVTRPVEEVCFLSHDAEMDAEEGRLQLALLVLAAAPGGP